MKKLLVLPLLLLPVVGCAEFTQGKKIAISYRAEMNDQQADITYAGLCDLAYGALLRRPMTEQQAARLVCAEGQPDEILLPDAD